MSALADRWARIATAFEARVAGTVDWEAPAPCEGWVARDVVGHVTSWMPGLYAGALGRPAPEVPSSDVEPLAAWRAVDAFVRDLLADPGALATETSTMAGTMTLEQLIAMTGPMDLLVHTWDLARATGQDETLDADECAAFAAGLPEAGGQMDDAMRQSGQFGPRVPVPADADAQTRLLAFTGRTP